MRIWADRIEVGTADACWRWLGHHDRDGYPRINGGTAHRAVYALAVGEPGPTLHHTCENRWCVNPLHLVSLTRREHGIAHRRCDHGEEHRRYAATGSWCRVCKIAYHKRRKEAGSA